MILGSKLKIKQLVSPTEIAQFIENSGGISRSDLVMSLGSLMVNPLKTVEKTKTFKFKQMSGLSNRPVKVYYTSKTNYQIVITNHFNALGIFSLRESGMKISHPMILNDDNWLVEVVVNSSATILLKSYVVTSMNYQSIEHISPEITPLLVFADRVTFSRAEAEGLLKRKTVCVVVDGKEVVNYFVDLAGKLRGLPNANGLQLYPHKTNSAKRVKEILDSYDLSKYTKKGGNQK